MRGYFDESGTHNGSRVTVTTIAGYVGTIAQWRACLPKWQEALATDGEGMGEFHAADFEHYSLLHGWSDQKRDDFLDKLGTIINGHTWFGISGSVIVSAYDNLPDWVRDRIKDRYHFCFHVVMDLLLQRLASVWGGQPLILIFENKDKVKGRTQKDFQKIIEEDFHGQLGGFRFGTTANYPLLQLADFLVYEMNHGIDNALYLKKPVRKALNKIGEGRKVLFSYHDAETLKGLPALLEQDREKLEAGRERLWWPASWHKNYVPKKREPLGMPRRHKRS